MAEGACEGQPFLLVQKRAAVNCLPRLRSALASTRAPSPRIALGKRRRGVRGVLELLRAGPACLQQALLRDTSEIRR